MSDSDNEYIHTLCLGGDFVLREVYIEFFVLDNLLMNWLLLWLAAKIVRVGVRAWRLWASAAIGAAYCVFMFLPGYVFLQLFVFKVVLYAVMTFAAYKGRQYLKCAAAFLGVSFFLLFNNHALTTLIQLLVRDFGGTTAQVGTASAIMAAFEVTMLFMAYILNKFGFQRVFIFCSAAYVIRLIITASVSTVNGLFYVLSLQAFTYAVLIPAAMSYLARIVDERVRATAVTTYAAVAMMLSGILGNFTTAVFLANGFSAQSALIFFAFVAFLGFVLTMYGAIRRIW